MQNRRRAQTLSPLFRLTPYYEAAEAAGCLRYDVFSHTYAATGDFGQDPIFEYRELTQNVVLMDVACERQIALEGRDALALADYLVTRDLSKLDVGRLCYGFCCLENGNVITDLIIHRLADDLIWLSPTDTDLGLWARGIAMARGYEVHVHETDVAPLQIQGPHSGEVLRTLVGDRIAALRFFRSMPGSIANVPVVVSRTGWTGELGYEVYPLDSSKATLIWAEVIRAGAPFNMRPIAWSYIRALESGILAFPYLVIDDFNPFEHWRRGLVDLEKTSFIGQDALRRIVGAGGPPRQMIGLVGTAGGSLPDMERGWVAEKGGSAIGISRWSGSSPFLGRPIAIALVKRNSVEVGESITLRYDEGEVSMVVTDLPFIDREGLRPRGMSSL
jgi:glycine cleavage system aminomethyltransferase T